MPPIQTPPTPDGPVEQLKIWLGPVGTFLGALVLSVGAFLSSRSSNRVLTLSHDTLSAADLLKRLEAVEAKVERLEADKARLENLVDERDERIRQLELETDKLKRENQQQARDMEQQAEKIKMLQGVRSGMDAAAQTIADGQTPSA